MQVLSDMRGEGVGQDASAFSAGKQTLAFPAASLAPSASAGAQRGQITTANGLTWNTLDFDPSTAEFVELEIPFPKSWNEGAISFQVIWSHPTTATNFGVVWSLEALAVGDGDALNAALGTAVTVTDTGGAADTFYRSPESGAVTIAGPVAEGDVVKARLGRAPANAADLMAVDARLHTLLIFFTTSAATDA